MVRLRKCCEYGLALGGHSDGEESPWLWGPELCPVIYPITSTQFAIVCRIFIGNSASLGC